MAAAGGSASQHPMQDLKCTPLLISFELFLGCLPLSYSII
uniref:Uncharacterized protein n=1 Tax=Zea mays TaxID=4577 RepID=C0PAE6_MAIZE|nr:unknown [Zea mays]